MNSSTTGKVAIVWRGPAETRGEPVSESSRFYPVFQALAAEGLTAEPAVYSEKVSAAVRDQLLACDGVLVWVDPLTVGRTRDDLDAILREVASTGVWVSAHPDVILKMGTKEVLYRTRHLGWGGDTVLYRDFAEFTADFPARLLASGPRVLKQYRGNGGQGVWKVAVNSSLPHVDHVLRLQEATHRDATATETTLSDFMRTCEAYFSGAGRLIDQAYQPRIVEGMVRCYMSGRELVGFARQYPTKIADGSFEPQTFGIPAAKTMYGPDEPEFQPLRQKLEGEWTPQMQQVLAIDDFALPALWDVDFLFGPKAANGADTFVLCEINVSCVSPFPSQAPARIAATATQALSARRLPSRTGP